MDTNNINLELCAQYFINGGIWEWVGGGAVVLITVLGALTKWNIPAFAMQIAKAVKNKGKK